MHIARVRVDAKGLEQVVGFLRGDQRRWDGECDVEGGQAGRRKDIRVHRGHDCRRVGWKPQRGHLGKAEQCHALEKAFAQA